MAEFRLSRSEALVLKGFDLGEADRILTLLTPARGKVRVTAKGVRRTRSRMSGHLDLFTRSTVLLARGRQMDIVTQAETIDSFRAMREDLWRTAYAQYVAELLDQFAVEEAPNRPLYALAVRTFTRLALGADLDLMVRAFELSLLGLMGYRPRLFRCLECERPIEPGANRFNAARGGVLCPDCGALDRAAGSVADATLKLLRNLQANEDAVLALPGIAPSLRREAELRLREYITLHLERSPRAVAFLDRLRLETATR